jgi:hypothetical protein
MQRDQVVRQSQISARLLFWIFTLRSEATGKVFTLDHFTRP